MKSSESNVPVPYGGFSSYEAQQINTQHRGMESDATFDEVLAYEQANRDVVNAEFFGYPLGTPSLEIGRDILSGITPQSD